MARSVSQLGPAFVVRSAALVACAWLLTLAAQLRAADPPRIAAVSAALQTFVDQGELSGAVALAAVDGQIVHLDGVGWANLERRQPMQPDTLFSIMSMTKPVTAVAALQLCDAGKLSLDEPISRWLPEYAGAPHEGITLRRVLSHTSGLMSDQRNRGTLAETVTDLAGRKLVAPPGTRWAYSPGLTVAGRIVEVVSGQPFEDYVAEHICRPLEMIDTSFRPTAEQLERLATVYVYSPAEGKLKETAVDFLGPLESRSPNPSGGLYSTATDLFRFYQMLLNHGELEGHRILSADTVREMTTSQTGEMPAGFVPGSAWGLGVGLVAQPQGVTEMLSPGTFGHGGMLGTQAWADPRRQVFYLLLIQRFGLANGDASPYRQALQAVVAESLPAEAVTP